MCGEGRLESEGLTWTSEWKLMSDRLTLPNGAAWKGGLLAEEGGYHYVSETGSRGGGGWRRGTRGLNNLEATGGELRVA